MTGLTKLGFLALLCGVTFATTTPAFADAPAIRSDYVYGHKDGMALTFDIITPAEPNGAGVCFMVSGGWKSRWSPPEQALQLGLLSKIVDEGFTLFLVRHGSSPKFKVPEAVADVRSAIQCIKANAQEFGIDPARLGVCGGSAGGHLSTMLGTTGEENQRAAVVAAYFPPTDLVPFMDDEELKSDYPALQFDPDQADEVSPARHVTADDAPTLLVHGDQDQLVTLSHSEELKSKLDAAGVECKLIVIKGAAHGFAGKDAELAEQAVIDWFNGHLK